MKLFGMFGRTRVLETENTMNSTELYLKLRSKYPKEVIDLHCMVLEFRVLDDLNPDIQVLGPQKNMIMLVLHKESGIPYVMDSLDAASGKNMGFKVSYAELFDLMSEEKIGTYLNLNAETWYEYTVMQVGDRIPIFGSISGTGPYHDETHFEIRMTDKGFVIIYEEISPMGGGYSGSTLYPFGFFKDKSIEEIEEILKHHAIYIKPEKIKLGIGDYNYLIRTDAYKTR